MSSAGREREMTINVLCTVIIVQSSRLILLENNIRAGRLRLNLIERLAEFFFNFMDR